MEHRLRVSLLLFAVLSLPFFGGALPVGADHLPPPLDTPPLDQIEKSLFPDDPPETAPFPQVAAGASHTCAVIEGDAYCWGRNDYGQLGDGTTTDRTTPVAVSVGAGLASGTVASIALGYSHTCAVTGAGDAYCWGRNDYGQLGDGTTTQRTSPVAVSVGAGLASGTVASIEADYHHTCAVTIGGFAYCWGYNPFGGLGDGTTTNRMTPVAVSVGAGLASGTVASIEAGSFHSCAVTTVGTAYCWGYNDYGQLGDGTTTQRTSPVAVSVGAGLASGTVAAITAGNLHTCAVTIGGTAYCWGYNANGQLGDGTTTGRTTPVAVSVGAGLASGTVAAITTGSDHTCAVTIGGTAYCWGRNSEGQLGEGTTTQRTSPVAVSVGAGLASGTVASITAGGSHTCGITTARTIYCWGYNGYGQLGDGTSTDRSTPAAVAGLPAYVAPQHCDDPATRVDKFDWSNGANYFEVDIHEYDDAVYTCVYAERNGDVLVDEVIRIPGEVISIDDNAPPGNGPGSPCTTDHGEGGNASHRAYARSTPPDQYPATVCVGVTSTTAGNHHVRIIIG